MSKPEQVAEALAEVVRLALPEGSTMTAEQVAEVAKPEEVAANTARIYEWLSEKGFESDSVAREAVFEFAAASLSLPYEAFYEAWLAEKPVVVPSAGTMSATEMLRVHRAVWDMPTLVEQHPEVVQSLMTRYEVVFPEMFTGEVYVLHHATGAMEKMGTKDVREAVATLLEREVAAEGRCSTCGDPLDAPTGAGRTASCASAHAQKVGA